jgi:hypothetical protein
MKHKGIKSSTSLADVVAQLLAKGEAVDAGGKAADEPATPPTSRFQSALAQRIAAANVMWGAIDVVDFKVREIRAAAAAASF